jgi:hypothetical protein
MPLEELVVALLSACQSTLANALRPSCHPGLQRWLPNSSLSPAQLAACDSNVRAALQQQVRVGWLMMEGWAVNTLQEAMLCSQQQ